MLVPKKVRLAVYSYLFKGTARFPWRLSRHLVPCGRIVQKFYVNHDGDNFFFRGRARR